MRPGVAAYRSEIAADHDGKTYPGAYVSAEVYASTDLEGIAYRSRLSSDQLCIALFDCANHKSEILEEGVPIDRGWIDNFLELRGKYVIDL